MQENFEFEMPECYSKIDDKSIFDLNDFTLNLTFQLDKDCLEKVELNLIDNEKYVKTTDNNITTYFKEINDSEYAKLELNRKNMTLNYLFIHH